VCISTKVEHTKYFLGVHSARKRKYCIAFLVDKLDGTIDECGVSLSPGDEVSKNIQVGVDVFLLQVDSN